MIQVPDNNIEQTFICIGFDETLQLIPIENSDKFSY
jgi:hypothetical protein